MTTDAETTQTSAETPPQWQGILDPDEKILWQGRPDQAFHLAPKNLPLIAFPLFFSGFAVFWMTKVAEMGGVFWMFGLIHFSVGIGIAWKTFYGDTARLRGTWYTLTDRRAFIATESTFKGRELKSYPIAPDAPVSYLDGPPPTVFFAREKRTGDKGRSYSVRIGFERIADGREVIGLLRKIQARGKEPGKEET